MSVCACGHAGYEHRANGTCGCCSCQQYSLTPVIVSKGPLIGTHEAANTTPPKDMVNHPPHYTQGKIEVIDFIEDQKLGYHTGQVIKYVSRHQHKNNPLEDLKKARWYLNRLIEQMEKGS